MALSKEGNALEEGVSALIILWDSNTKPPQHPGLTYTWDGYSEQETVRSLYRYVEAHGERLREKYLSWIHELGQSRIRKKRLIDHLVIQDGLSYWWMTLFVEKSPWKSPAPWPAHGRVCRSPGPATSRQGPASRPAPPVSTPPRQLEVPMLAN